MGRFAFFTHDVRIYRPVCYKKTLFINKVCIYKAKKLCSCKVYLKTVIREDAYTRQRVSSPAGYAFDNPFFKAWVIQHTLEDIGISPEKGFPELE